MAYDIRAETTSLWIKRIQDADILPSIKSKWNALLAESDTKTVELTYEWQISYWESFHQNSELFILLVVEGTEIIALAPLKRTFYGIPGARIRCLEIISASESNYQDLVIGRNTNEVLHCILNYLIRNKEDWDLLCLKHIPETSNSANFFLKVLDSYPLRELAATDKCAYLQIDTTWEEHKKGLGKDRKHRMKNRVTRIEREMGPLHFEICECASQFDHTLSEFFALHRKRWDATETPSQFLDSRFCDFYTSAGTQLFSKNQLNIAQLSAGGKIVAQLLYFHIAYTSLIQLIAYDPVYYSYSPMLLLQEYFVEKSLSDRVKIIDWGTYYPWKELWANKTKQRMNLTLFPKKIRSNIIFLFMKGYKMLYTGVLQSSSLMKWAKLLRGKIRWLGRRSQGVE